MASPEPFVYISYSHQDRAFVDRVVADLRSRNIRTWRDVEQLHGGDDWRKATSAALEATNLLLVFVSPNSMASEFVQSEWQEVARRGINPIIPVIIKHAKMPNELTNRIWVDFAHNPYEIAFNELVDTIQRNVLISLLPPSEPLSPPVFSQFDDRIQTQNLPKSVFIVHGHDQALLEEVSNYLESLNVTPIILNKVANQSQRAQGLFDKFWEQSGKAEFAIILFSHDDLGTAVREYRQLYEGNLIKGQALRYRARQNVVLELGFFYGRLGTEKVFVLQKFPLDENNKPIYYPFLERPSDLDGVLFDVVDPNGEWKKVFYGRLVAAQAKAEKDRLNAHFEQSNQPRKTRRTKESK